MIMFSRTSKTVAFLLLAGISTACVSKTAPVVDSGLPEDKVINELTADEADQFCDAFISTANEELASVDACRSIGFVAAALAYAFTGASEEEMQEQCETSYDECQEDEEQGTIELTECNTTTMAQESCEATVGELEACIGDQIGQMVDGYRDMPSCASITVEEVEEYLETAEDEPETTPACEVAEAACPDGF